MIEARRLSKTYGGGDRPQVHALHAVDLRVEAGEVALVMGPSGSGKSTLLSLLGGLQAPSSGAACVAGTDVHALGAAARAAFRRERVGFVFQRFRLLDALTVRENVALVLHLAGAQTGRAWARVDELLEHVGLRHRAEHRPRSLSGGEQQRVAVARALAHDPPVVLADEPTGNLDAAAGAAVVDLLAGAAARGRAVLIATHDARLRAHAHRLVHLSDGRREEDEQGGGRDETWGADHRSAGSDRSGSDRSGSYGAGGVAP